MSDEEKTRLDEIDRRIDSSDKRFDDLKYYLAGAATFFTLWFFLLTLVSSWNSTSERDSLRDFQKDLREDLGKSESIPEVLLLGVDRSPLEGQEVRATFKKAHDGGLELTLEEFIKNVGNGATGPMYVKLYTKKPLQLDDQSTDETQYDYESAISPADLQPDTLPGNFSDDFYFDFYLPSGVIPPSGTYPAILKIYYGKGKVTQAHITIRVSGQNDPIPGSAKPP